MNRALFSLSLLLSNGIYAAQEAPQKITLPIQVEVLAEQRPNMQIDSWLFRVEANLEDSMSPVLEGLRKEIENRGKRKVDCTCGKCTETIIACAIAESPSKLVLYRRLKRIKEEDRKSAKKILVKDIYRADNSMRLSVKQKLNKKPSQD